MKFYGEFDTDKIIRSYFPDYSYKGTLIEIGSAGPDYLSLSKHFKENGWNTIGVEANPYFVGLQKAAGNRIINVALSNYNAENVDFQILIASEKASYEGGKVTMESCSALKPMKGTEAWLQNAILKEKKTIKVQVRTLDFLFENELSDIKRTDVITIDVEGGELDVLRGFTKKELYPSILVIESLSGDRNAEESQVLNSMGYIIERTHKYNHFYKKRG
jgi:FkbM family methyltransferase